MGLPDGVEALVVFRSERANYTGDIGVFVDGSDHAALTVAGDPALDTFTYYGETANTSGGTPLVFEQQAVTTPDGSTSWSYQSKFRLIPLEMISCEYEI